MTGVPSPTLRLRRLGLELKRLRELAGLTADEAATALDCHGSKISRMENGRSAVRPRDVRDLLARYGVVDRPTFARLEGLARHGRDRGWWQDFGDAVAPDYADYVSLEAGAVGLDTFEAMLVPGLLQSPAYMRAVFAAHPATLDDAQVDARMHVRALRQQALDRDESPLALWAVVHEAALRTPVGGRREMRRQLGILRDRAAQRNITVQALPLDSGAHAGMHGSFGILRYPEAADLDVVFTEHLTGAFYIEEPAQVTRYLETFDRLRANAMSPRATLAFIEQCGEDL
ncbi:helix-turn-helix domain-containing protein [Streptomycetaceae bacterium NBC_01309]